MSDERVRCRECGKMTLPRVEILQSGPHYAKSVCTHCGTYIAFLKKPDNEGKRPKNKYTPDSLQISYCQMCRRDRDSKTWLEVHHVKEIQHGGEDTPDNIWVLCNACHSLVHWTRYYLNRSQEDAKTVVEAPGIGDPF